MNAWTGYCEAKGIKQEEKLQLTELLPAVISQDGKGIFISGTRDQENKMRLSRIGIKPNQTP